MPRFILGLPIITMSMLGCERPATRGSASETTVTVGYEVTVRGPADTIVRRVNDLASDGSQIWAAVTGGYSLVAFDLTGQPTGMRVHRGEGPEETGPIFSVSLNPEGRPVVHDARHQRVLVLGPGGDFTALRHGPEWESRFTAKAENLMGGSAEQMVVVSHGRIVRMYSEETFDRSDAFNVMTLVVDSAGSRRTLWDLGANRKWLDSIEGRESGFMPFPLWAACGSEEVAVYEPRDNTVRVIALDESVRRSFQVRTEPARLSREEKREWGFVLMRSQAGGQVADSILRKRIARFNDSQLDELKSIAPAYARIQCSREGEVLLERTNIPMGAIRRDDIWELYRANQEVREIIVPNSWQLPTFGRPAELLAIELDSLDVPRVVGIRLKN